jgi:hypothetical protein
MPWAQLVNVMPAQEYEEHLAEYRLSPWDELRDDLRAGLICSLLANIHRTKDRPPFKAADFMPYLSKVAPASNEYDAIKQFFGGT